MPHAGIGCGRRGGSVEPDKESSISIDYSTGRFIAYGIGSDGPRIGWLQNGVVNSDSGTWQFTIDGDKFYGGHGEFVGYIESGIASQAATSQFLFRLERD